MKSKCKPSVASSARTPKIKASHVSSFTCLLIYRVLPWYKHLPGTYHALSSKICAELRSGRLWFSYLLKNIVAMVLGLLWSVVRPEATIRIKFRGIMWNSSLNPAACSHFTFNLQIFHKSKRALLGLWFPTACPFSKRISGKIMHLKASDDSEGASVCYKHNKTSPCTSVQRLQFPLYHMGRHYYGNLGAASNRDEQNKTQTQITQKGATEVP